MAQSLFQEAALHEQQGRRAAAIAALRAAITLQPDMFEAHINLGNVLQDSSDLPGAIDSFRRALVLRPTLGAIYLNLGAALHANGQLTEAIDAYREALARGVLGAQVYNNLAIVLRDDRRLPEALAAFEQALALEPRAATIHLGYADTLRAHGRLEAALAALRTAQDIDPQDAGILRSLGNTLVEMGRVDEGLDALRAAVARGPAFPAARSDLLFALNYSAADAALCVEEARRFGAALSAAAPSPFTRWKPAELSPPLRVGLVSADLREHPVGHFLENVVRELAASGITLHAYANSDHLDALSARLRPTFAQWLSITRMSDEQAARLIHDDGLHVLLDLSGHTAGNRLGVFARRPAPVQVSWLGYFATTGLAQMDYFIADPWTVPAGHESAYTESVWRLPRTRLCFTAPHPPVSVGALPATTNAYITFGCFNNLSKLGEPVLEAWSRILAAVPQSRLFLKARQLGDATGRARLVERLAAWGVAPDRLILEGASPRADYLAAYNRVDIGLDPFPYTGGTTSVEALWMGVPFVTLAGSTLIGRQGVGLLANCGLDDWIALDPEAYVRTAVERAGDIPALAASRARLRDQVLASPIFDAPAFAADLAAALQDMWSSYRDRAATTTAVPGD